MLRHQWPRQAFSERQPENFSSVWSLCWPLMGMKVAEASQLRPTREEFGPSPLQERRLPPLGKEDGPLGVPGPSPRPSEIPWYVEPAEQTTAPVTSTVSNSCSSWNGKKLCEEIGVDPNNPCKHVLAYWERDSRLPEWWKKFLPLVCSMDRHCNKAKVKSLAWQQAVTFCLPVRKYMVPGLPHPVWQC